MHNPTEGPHTPEALSDRQAGGLLVAFLAAVVLVLALATMPPIQIESTSTHEPMGTVEPAVGR